MSYLLLHNGNQLVKSRAAKFYNCKEMPCLTDDWGKQTDLHQKYLLASRTQICTDLTTADRFDIKELFNAKNSFQVIKVITSYDSDIANLEPIWDNGYDKKQWTECIFSRLSLADYVVFHQPIKLDCLHSGPAIVFTPGRSGTHVIIGLTGLSKNNALHHNKNLLTQDGFINLINAEKIFSILRKKFVDQVMSDAISNTYGFMVTTADDLEANRLIVSKWKPLTLSATHYQFTLEKLFNYADLLIGIKMFYNKQIEFSLLENLKEHFDKIPYIKNPYQSKDIISNYAECVDVCNHEYQPIYDQLITKLQCILGTNLYNHE